MWNALRCLWNLLAGPSVPGGITTPGARTGCASSQDVPDGDDEIETDDADADLW